MIEIDPTRLCVDCGQRFEDAAALKHHHQVSGHRLALKCSACGDTFDVADPGLPDVVRAHYSARHGLGEPAPKNGLDVLELAMVARYADDYQKAMERAGEALMRADRQRGELAEAEDGCPQRTKCGGTCGKPIAFLFTWPGQKQMGACAHHAKLAHELAKVMTFELELRPFCAPLAIRFETLPPRHDAYPTHLYVMTDHCRRCGQLTPVLCIEVSYPDVDTAGRDVDTSTFFCPTCLEQLAREVRAKIPELAR